MIRRLEKCCGTVYATVLISFRIKFHYACTFYLYYIFRIKCYRSHMRYVLLLSIICGKKKQNTFLVGDTMDSPPLHISCYAMRLLCNQLG
jgi:hypothetical protein